MTTILLLKDTASTRYVVHALTPIWRDMGYRVVEHAGLRSLPAADLLFLHIDRTVVPDHYAAVCARYPVALNERALDISRRRYSQALQPEHDAYDGRVTPDQPVAVPPELRRWRETLGLDYGRFDYVVHDGRAVLLDVNKTMGAGDDLEAYREPFAALATGLRDFLP